MEMSGKKGMKRKKAYYVNAAKKKRRYCLEPGMKGFLITCNSREKDAVKEAYNLLNEYADQLYGPEKTEDSAPSGGEEEDIEAALEKEVANLQSETSGGKDRRFQVVDTNTNNCVFIKTTLPNPYELADAIFSDVAATHKQKSRYILRFMPISTTCRATEEAINKHAEEFLNTHFGYGENGRSYSILFKSRNNNAVSRTMVINLFGRLVSEMNPTNHANLRDPDLAIIVEVVCKVCCLSVVKNYSKFKRFNILEVARQEEQAQKLTETTDVTEKKDAHEISSVDATEKKCAGEISSADDLKKCVAKNTAKADTEKIDNENVREQQINVAREVSDVEEQQKDMIKNVTTN